MNSLEINKCGITTIGFAYIKTFLTNLNMNKLRLEKISLKGNTDILGCMADLERAALPPTKILYF
jgi:hypothetical protein